jgi:hypothetical protein
MSRSVDHYKLRLGYYNRFEVGAFVQYSAAYKFSGLVRLEPFLFVLGAFAKLRKSTISFVIFFNP